MGGRFATEEALREIHRVLRPGEAFGMIWNIEDCESFIFSILTLSIRPDMAQIMHQRHGHALRNGSRR